MAEPLDSYMGEIRLFAGTYAPDGWNLCDGTLLTINGNEALFAVLGTTYGGNGSTTFALPDLRGRVPLHYGTGVTPTGNLTQRKLGQTGGAEEVTLVPAEMPAHNHVVSAVAATAPTGLTLTPGSDKLIVNGNQFFSPNLTTSVSLDPISLLTAYQSQPHDNMMPCRALNFIISLSGLFPTRPS